MNLSKLVSEDQAQEGLEAYSHINTMFFSELRFDYVSPSFLTDLDYGNLVTLINPHSAQIITPQFEEYISDFGVNKMASNGCKPLNLPKVLRDNEISLLYSVCDRVERVILDLYLRSGLRLSEGRKLRVKDLDFTNRIIYVKQGKRGKDRHIPLDHGLSKILQSYIKDFGLGSEDHILSVKRGGRPYNKYRKGKTSYSRTSVNMIIRGIGERAGIQEDFITGSNGTRGKSYRIRPHLLRHTYGTMIQEALDDPFVTKEVLGHSSLQMTEIYVHLSQKKKRKAVDIAFKDLDQPQTVTLSHYLN